jgi:hypothetical protein
VRISISILKRKHFFLVSYLLFCLSLQQELFHCLSSNGKSGVKKYDH